MNRKEQFLRAQHRKHYMMIKGSDTDSQLKSG